MSSDPSNSNLAGNTTAGLETEGTSAVNVQNSVISGNGTGIQVAGGTVRLPNSDIAFNTTAVSGTVTSFSNNRFTGTVGGTITAITPTGTNPSGQQ